MFKFDFVVVEEFVLCGKGCKNNFEKICQDIFCVVIDEFVVQGFLGVWVDVIVECMYILKWMIYYYFGSKEQFYQVVLEKFYSDICGIEGILWLGVLLLVKVMEKLVEFSFDYYDWYVDFVCIISIENIYKGEYIVSSELVQSVNSLIVQSIVEIFCCGEVEGVFCVGLEVFDVYMLISLFCFYWVFNCYIVLWIFCIDLYDVEVCQWYWWMIGEVVLCYICV